MGAFFLHKTSADFDIKAVQNVFYNKGFTEPSQFQLNDMTLILYRKQLLDEDNYYFPQNGCAIFATGTIIYKGENYKNSLRYLLADFLVGEIDYAEIIGAFCLIFYNNKSLYFLTDRSNIYHIYTNNDQSIISSSFLALITAHKKKLHLNKMAFIEQLTIGYTTGTETIIKEISIINNLYKEQNKSPYLSFLAITEFNKHQDTYEFANFQDCVNHQLKSLKQYYDQIRLLGEECGTDIGLSGGYDSRLNFLLADTLGIYVTAHTHCSIGHAKEIEIADMIAKENNIPLRKISISDPLKISAAEIERNLKDSLYYYDGRTNQTMGTFNDVDTRRYRMAILGNNRLGLNGLGGELYRNHTGTIYEKVKFIEWLKYNVMDPYAVVSIKSKVILHEFLEYVTSKYSVLLKTNLSNYVDRLTLRRFFAFIWLPYAAGIKSQAENQLAFFLMPFTDYQIVNEALKATPFIGISGKFEAAMIMSLNERIACIPSSYGFGFNNEPFSHSLQSGLRCFTPGTIKNYLGILKVKYKMRNVNPVMLDLKKHAVIMQIIDILHSLKLPIDIDKLFFNRSHFERLISTGYLLYRFSDKFSLNN